MLLLSNYPQYPFRPLNKILFDNEKENAFKKKRLNNATLSYALYTRGYTTILSRDISREDFASINPPSSDHVPFLNYRYALFVQMRIPRAIHLSITIVTLFPGAMF